ncbi:unnamed protein product [Dovyalis caffra]|uniref:Uncharacterized protein n=1 Tax=Dovyalis caffra TaxID=77055 RepID=A0AAV1SQJ5_9ROSI|nr:unnamed protein product [Dovyalis caffra]
MSTLRAARKPSLQQILRAATTIKATIWHLEERVVVQQQIGVGQREEDPSGEVEERDIVQRQIGVAGNIGFFEAWRIPGVPPFALSLFFTKLSLLTLAFGTHSSIIRTSRALATVAAIVNGTGSFGEALGPLLTGLIHGTERWNVVSKILAVCVVIAMLILSRQVLGEVKRKRRQRHGPGGEAMNCPETHMLVFA